MKVLVINLCQMGDLVQTTPFFHDLKSKGAHVTLMVRRDQEETARHLPDVDRIVALDLSGLKQQLRKESRDGVEEAFRGLKEQLGSLLQEEFDNLYNMTHTRIGALLSEAVKSGEKKGLLIPDGKNRWISSRAIRYLQQTLSARNFNNIHVVDLHRTLLQKPLQRGNLRFQVTPEEEKKADQILRRYGIGETDLVIGIQAGANELKKRWPTGNYAELSEMILHDRDARILVFGVESELPMAGEITSRSEDKIVNLAGKTDVGLLSALLGRCRILISNDTGTSHMAAAVGTPVLTLHLSHVYFRETAPYGEGHLSVQVKMACSPCSHLMPCDHFRCHDLLTPAAVYHVVKQMLDNTAIPEDPSMENIEVFVSGFDERNFLTHRPLLRAPPSPDDFLREVYGTHWKRYLTGEDLSDPTSLKSTENPFNEGSGKEIASFLKETDHLLEICTEAQKISNSLARGASNRMEKQKISASASRFKALHEQILKIGTKNPRLRPLTEFYEIEQQNIRAKDLPGVMRSFEGILKASCKHLKKLREIVTA